MADKKKEFICTVRGKPCNCSKKGCSSKRPKDKRT